MLSGTAEESRARPLGMQSRKAYKDGNVIERCIVAAVAFWL